MSDKPWYVYVLTSESSGRTYTGIALDPEQRLLEHNGIRQGGAKATRMGRPWCIGRVYGPCCSRSEAQKLEYRLKQLPREKKLEQAPPGD